MSVNRVLIVANRLPVTACAGAAGVELVPSCGGLASGLRTWHVRTGGRWIGWPGDVTGAPPAQRAAIDQHLQDSGMVPVHLSAEQVAGYYREFANRVVWPLFHYSIDRIPADAGGWIEYQQVNEVFAETIAREYRTGDTIWVHDYHLMLLPELLRQRLPRARIGFFLHIPFPASEVFRVLPWGRAILTGLLGADLIGFHTFSYLRHFMTSLMDVEGVEPEFDCVRTGDRTVQAGVFPMGVDAASFDTIARDPDVRAQIDGIRRDAGGRLIVLGVDRLDYTKGIPRRLEAVARVFERHPELRDSIRYIQVAVPSRGEVDSYQHLRRHVEETVGRLNGAYGTLQSLPFHYVHQSVTTRDLVALYGAADVMLVTPLRDGMNLVAKEFVASRVDEDGVLVLSEFAGASAELHGAVTVNPYDGQALADSITRGLSMPLEERRARMRGLRRRVHEHDVFAWADGFVQSLGAARPPESTVRARPEPAVETVLTRARPATKLRLLLDYDGTLVPLARSPGFAVPDDRLLALLAQLASSPGIRLDIVSGRPREPLEEWFSGLPVALWAEHGVWHRRPGDHRWQPTMPLDTAWIARVKPILERFAANTPGAHVEVKTASLAWHYREAARDVGRRQAYELRLLLRHLLTNQPLEVLEGRKVIEVRTRGASKGLVAQCIQAEPGPRPMLVAIGDDRTDDDLFRALPDSAVSIAVGHASTAARYRVDDYRAVRRLLELLVYSNSSFATPTAVMALGHPA